MSTTALQALRNSGIHISSDTAEYHQITSFKADLSDATTNPSLVLAAVSKREYADIIQDAVHFARFRLPSGSVKDVTALAMDRALVQVGARISEIVPGRVSVSVDPRIANDAQAIIRKGRDLVALLEELNIPRTRILIKIPATYDGIVASQALEHPESGKPIHTNMTLVFGQVQAIACAEAGVSVISPFIGRVKDWWNTLGSSNTELSQHPGILLVQNIRSIYSALGIKTHIMAAGFRAVEEVVEVGKYGVEGGPDVVTLPPNLLDGLRKLEYLKKPLVFKATSVNVDVTPKYFSPDIDAQHGVMAYARDIAHEKIAAVKVPEGLAKFSADVQILEDLIKATVTGSIEVPVSAVL